LQDAQIAEHVLVFVLYHAWTLVAEVEDSANDVDGGESAVEVEVLDHVADDGVYRAECAGAANAR